MIQRFLSWFGSKLLTFIHIQLYVSIVSLPILLSWGLPISVLAPVGNFIFSPFLTLFLGISCIIFFTELCYIPNGIFIWCLEKLTHIWQYALSYADNRCLLSFKSPSPWFFVLLLLATAAVIYHKKLQGLIASSFIFISLLCVSYLYLTFLGIPPYAIKQLPCNNAHITIIKTPTSCTIIDPGILGRRISAPSWVEYTLLPTVRSTLGANNIETIILLAPGIVLFDAMVHLLRLMPIKNIYIPYWKGNEPKLVRAYQQLREAASKHGTTIHRIGTKNIAIMLDKKSTLSLTPLDAICTYRTNSYNAIKVIGQLPEDTITLYSSKYIT